MYSVKFFLPLYSLKKAMSVRRWYIYICLGFLFCIWSKPLAWGQTDVKFPHTPFSAYLPSDSIFAHYLHRKGIPITRNNAITILSSGSQKFQYLFQDVAKAQHLIHMEYFNFRNDSIAKLLFQHVEARVKDSVKVRAMYDDFGNMSNNRPLRKKHLIDCNARGVELRPYDPIRFPFVNHLFHRDHQKIVVIDNQVAYTGGMNVADYYIHGTEAVGEWRDMHLRLEGQVAIELQKAFLYTWNKESKQNISMDSLLRVSPPTFDTQTDTLGGRVAIVQRIPRKTPEAIREAYIAAIDAAEHTIQLINPYFTPTQSITKALKRAIRRGVRVEIMLSEASDIPVTPDAAMYKAYRLHKQGAHIYIFRGGFHHSKILIVDGRFATVGSANLNARSLRYDYEINAFLFDLPAVAKLVDIFEKDKGNSYLLTQETYRRKGFWKRMWRWAAHLLTPFL